MASDLYAGVPVKINAGLNGEHPRGVYFKARFWFPLYGGDKAAVVIWHQRHSYCKVVRLSRIRISDDASDPPPMPDWTRSHTPDPKSLPKSQMGAKGRWKRG